MRAYRAQNPGMLVYHLSGAALQVARVMTLRCEWRAECDPVTLRFSHADAIILDEAYFRVAAALRAKRIGANITRGVGVWEGKTEPSYTVEFLGIGRSELSTVITAAISAGCEAIQVERGARIVAEEWRSS